MVLYNFSVPLRSRCVLLQLSVKFVQAYNRVIFPAMETTLADGNVAVSAAHGTVVTAEPPTSQLLATSQRFGTRVTLAPARTDESHNVREGGGGGAHSMHGQSRNGGVRGGAHSMHGRVTKWRGTGWGRWRGIPDRSHWEQMTTWPTSEIRGWLVVSPGVRSQATNSPVHAVQSQQSQIALKTPSKSSELTSHGLNEMGFRSDWGFLGSFESALPVVPALRIKVVLPVDPLVVRGRIRSDEFRVKYNRPTVNVPLP